MKIAHVTFHSSSTRSYSPESGYLHIEFDEREQCPISPFEGVPAYMLDGIRAALESNELPADHSDILETVTAEVGDE